MVEVAFCGTGGGTGGGRSGSAGLFTGWTEDEKLRCGGEEAGVAARIASLWIATERVKTGPGPFGKEE